MFSINLHIIFNNNNNNNKAAHFAVGQGLEEEADDQLLEVCTQETCLKASRDRFKDSLCATRYRRGYITGSGSLPSKQLPLVRSTCPRRDLNTRQPA